MTKYKQMQTKNQNKHAYTNKKNCNKKSSDKRNPKKYERKLKKKRERIILHRI